MTLGLFNAGIGGPVHDGGILDRCTSTQFHGHDYNSYIDLGRRPTFKSFGHLVLTGPRQDGNQREKR